MREIEARRIGTDTSRSGRGRQEVLNGQKPPRVDAPNHRLVRFQIVARNEEYQWELFNPSGAPIARSATNYPTEVAAAQAAEQARANIGNAPVVPSA
jgi:hypothetical protein